MTDAPAGWYPDPEGSERERYWDGLQWTEFRDLVPPPPPAAGVPAPPTPPTSPTPPAVPMQPQTVVVQQKSNRGCLYALLAVIALAVIGCVGTVVIIATAADEVVDTFVEVLEENERLVIENTKILRCEKAVVSDWAEVSIEFTSPFDEEKGFISIEINFLDPEDVVVGSATVVLENLEPGQTAREDATAFGLSDGAEVDRCVIADASAL